MAILLQMMMENPNRAKLHNVLKLLLAEGQVVELPVYGYSMFPFLKPGTTVRLVKFDKNDYKVGDVVFFETNEQLVLHRVVVQEFGILQCRGDAMVEYDTPVADEKVFGKMVAYNRGRSRWRQSGSFAFRFFSTMVLTFGRTSGYFFRYMARWHAKPGRRWPLSPGQV